MGGYIYNRLFCIWKSISAGYLLWYGSRDFLVRHADLQEQESGFCIWTSKEHGRCIRLSMHSQQVW